MELKPRTFIILAGQNQFIHENIFNNAPIRTLAIAMNTKVLSPVIKMEILSIIKSLVYEKLKYREGIKLLRTWILVEIVLHTLQQ